MELDEHYIASIGLICMIAGQQMILYRHAYITPHSLCIWTNTKMTYIQY